MVKKSSGQPPKTVVGQRCGKLVVRDPGPWYNNETSNRLAKRNVLVQCDCGFKPFYTREINILRGLSTQCLSCRRKNHGDKLRKETTGWTHWYNRYKQNARNRSRVIDFEISMDEFQKICSQDCFYCGERPSLRTFPRGAKVLASGVDRKDPSKGYVLDNCVACCSLCNSMKWTLTAEEFIAHVQKLSRAELFSR